MQKAKIGSISHGTLRTADLLEAFASDLETLDEDGQFADLIKEAEEVDPESEEASEVLAEVGDALDEFAPSYCYFGASEGDGSDFGFWPSFDRIEDGVRDGELLKLEAGSEISPGTEDGQAVMFVTDHGNIEFGHVRVRYEFVEEWSCV